MLGVLAAFRNVFFNYLLWLENVEIGNSTVNKSSSVP
nr:DUF1564 domain-containing protein [Leptospira noguchii]